MQHQQLHCIFVLARHVEKPESLFCLPRLPCALPQQRQHPTAMAEAWGQCGVRVKNDISSFRDVVTHRLEHCLLPLRILRRIPSLDFHRDPGPRLEGLRTLRLSS
jgi:hypothetical protein